MAALAQQRCLHHPLREAVSRCPGCRRFYCRECITEHEGRVLCAACLKQRTAKPQTRTWRIASIRRVAGLVFGLLLAWWVFYSAGRLLLLIPSSFHEGQVFHQ